MKGTAFALRDLFWEATKRCNAHCAFCGSSCGRQGEPNELTTEEILAAFRSIASDADATQIMVNVTGGEPLMREDLFHVMGECSRLGFPWGMVTNGLLITDEVIGQMQAAGMKTVSVSIDGTAETHDRLRGVPGGFARSTDALRRLRKAGFLQHIQVTTVVNRWNIGQLDALRQELLPIGLDTWRVVMVDGIGRAQGRDDLLLDTQGVRAYLDFIRLHRDDAELPVVTSCSHFLGYGDEALGRRPFRCRTGTEVGSILCNGDIFVCPNVPRAPELLQGNVRRDRFMQVWREGFGFFRDPESRRQGDCRTCPDWAACRGDSMHTWDLAAGEPGFCFRRHFPLQHIAPQTTRSQLIARLKERHGSLTGLCVRYEGCQGRQLVFTPQAVGELAAMFHWGQPHPASLSEQMGCLIGRELADCTLVEFVSPVFLEARSTEIAAYSGRSWNSAQEELRAINRSLMTEACREFCLFEEPCSLIGFVHSHPGDLPLAPSEPDVQLHEELTARGVSWSMIVNPQTRRLAAFHGEGMPLGEVMMIVEKGAAFSVAEA